MGFKGFYYSDILETCFLKSMIKGCHFGAWTLRPLGFHLGYCYTNYNIGFAAFL